MPDQFSGPVPGQSLTNQPGGSPWEQAPQYTDLNEFLEMLFDKLTEKRQATRIGVMLKAGLACEEIAKLTVYSAFTKGIINVDMALLATRPVIYMITSIGSRLGVKNMKIMLPDKEQADFLDNFSHLATNEPEPVIQEPAVQKPQFEGILGKLNG